MKVGRLIALALLALPACNKAAPTDADVETIREHPGRFTLSLLMADSETERVPVRSGCAVPIQGAPLPPAALRPEVGLYASAGSDTTTHTDSDGISALGDLKSGFQLIELASADGVAGRLTIDLATRRTDLHGLIDRDVDDVDADGDLDEWLLIVDALPDDNGDRISDTGRRSRWHFAKDGRVGFRHLADLTSAMILICCGSICFSTS